MDYRQIESHTQAANADNHTLDHRKIDLLASHGLSFFASRGWLIDYEIIVKARRSISELRPRNTNAEELENEEENEGGRKNENMPRFAVVVVGALMRLLWLRGGCVKWRTAKLMREENRMLRWG